MNKSILKHEMRSMKWMMLLSIIASLFLTIMFSISLDGRYQMIFYNGIRPNQTWIQDNLQQISAMALVLFTGLSIIQVFMQFRSEKNQEVGRFLKSLPVSKEEFFRIKLITGIMNMTLGFIVLAIGVIIVRNNNMFWIKDIYRVSIVAAPFMKADGVANLLKEIGLVYLVVLSFYTFLFMVQYTFTNVVGGIVTGFLVWLAPIFIVNSSIFIWEGLIVRSIVPRISMYDITRFSHWLLPWVYAFEHKYDLLVSNTMGSEMVRVASIENLEVKYIVCLALILVNIIIAYKFNKSSRIENESMIIPFKSTKNIFRLGVTICSGLLLSIILSQLIGIQMHKTIYTGSIILGGSIGYLISKKIAQVGNR